jgi:hypothetical protein
MASVHLQTSNGSLKWLNATLIQVLEKCQLLEAVQEKEQGLDSLGRRPSFLWNSAGTVYLIYTKKMGFSLPHKQLLAKFLGMVYFFSICNYLRCCTDRHLAV